MKYRLSVTRKFERNLKRLTVTEQKITARKLKMLQIDPFQRSLRTKKIKGLKGLFECSVSMDIRILWCYQEDSILLMLDIGHHSIVDHL
jgi:mRNA interferase RelE/StbE